ncbi:MAG: DoxX family protein [Proteobacteria bacterium]|jgi:putative oxidoreductase|nr:DoxX family protein [Pseudomonadota bacterium]MDA0941304.1 DoxX family protein [Pseudomonadota bacterium]
MTKHIGLIARILLAQIFFISILFIINNIISTPGGYGMYQDMLGARGLPGIMAPLSILVQFLGGLALILGFKTRIAAYILAAYSFIWAVVYFMNAMQGQPVLIMSLMYIAITGGLLLVGAHPENTGCGLDQKMGKK